MTLGSRSWGRVKSKWRSKFEGSEKLKYERHHLFVYLKHQGRQWNVRNLSNWELGVVSQIPVSDHELLIAKIRLKLQKVGKTTRPFRYDLNQIPYNYTVEVTDRFKGLDLTDRVPEELWMKICNIVPDAVIKTIHSKKKWKKAKWLSEKALK